MSLAITRSSSATRSSSVHRQSGNVPIMYAYVIVTGALGLLVNLLARLAEKRLLFWHPSVRSEALA